VASGSKLDVNGRESISPPIEESTGQLGESRSEIPSKECTERDNANPDDISAAPPVYKGSTSLLDEILANQSKILVPGKFLKINKDGSLSQKTEKFEKYLNGKSCKDTKVGDTPLGCVNPFQFICVAQVSKSQKKHREQSDEPGQNGLQPNGAAEVDSHGGEAEEETVRRHTEIKIKISGEKIFCFRCKSTHPQTSEMQKRADGSLHSPISQMGMIVG